MNKENIKRNKKLLSAIQKTKSFFGDARSLSMIGNLKNLDKSQSPENSPKNDS